jgi:superfamily II DNA or RNA helicase
MPLKFSKVFDNIFEYKKSIKQLMDESPLAKYNYKEVAKQFDDIYYILCLRS